MDIQYIKMQKLLQEKSELNARLKLIPYDGSIEIKEQGGNKYIYIRKRVLGKNTSNYVDVYSDELYEMISRQLRNAREYKKRIRAIDKELVLLGYEEKDLTSRILMNIDFARANMKNYIYSQAILEGIATTFPQTETIIENGKISNMKPTDVLKILNLKHAWEFTLDKDVIASKTHYYILCKIAELVNEGFYEYGGKIRSVPVSITGSTYKPTIPIEIDVKENIDKIVNREDEVIYRAIDLCLYCMKTQIFIDGNKRSSVIFANHFLIANGGGLLMIQEENVPKFKQLLVGYYEDRDNDEIKEFMKEECWKQF